MILSHRHKFIFMQCRKTAGSSISVSLARYLGPMDIQVGAMLDAMKFNIRPNLYTHTRLLTLSGFHEYVKCLLKGHKFKNSFDYAVSSYFANIYNEQEPDHAAAATIRSIYPKEWESYYKFCVVRNPYERLISEYRWTTRRSEAQISYSEFLKTIYDMKKAQGSLSTRYDNWNIYTIDDEIAVDRIVRYENLHDELRDTLKDIGLRWDEWLPYSKSANSSKNNEPIEQTPEDLSLISYIYSKEIKEFGYQVLAK